MRIAHVSATFPPYAGGTGNVSSHNAEILRARGHEVHVFTPHWPGSGPIDDTSSSGVRVSRLRPTVRFGNAALMPNLIRRLRPFDVIHLHYPFIGGAELIPRAGVPYVVTYHQDVILSGVRQLAVRAYEATIGRYVLRKAGTVFVTTLDYANHSIHAAEFRGIRSRLRELPNGVDLDRFQPGRPDHELRRSLKARADDLLLLFVGGLDRAHYFKGVPVLLEALSLTGARAALAIVGAGDLRPDYEDLAARLGLSGRVTFCGRVSDQDLPNYYRTGDALVLPSQTMGEAFGVVLVEAMATSKPVIATDLPGVRTVFEPNVSGLLVPPGNAAALALAIDSLAALNQEARSSMGKSGRQRVIHRFSADRIGDALEFAYNSAVR